MLEENKEICRRLTEEAWGKGLLSVVDQTVTTDCRIHDPAFPALGPGGESLKRHILSLRSTFPDLSCTCDDIVAERNEVVIHWTCQGTQRGAFMSFGPTNRSAMISGTSIHRLERGKVVELWADWNLQSLLDQLGLGMSTYDSNRKLAQRFIEEIWNRKKPDLVDHLVTPDFQRHSPNGLLRGADGFRQEFDTYNNAFPDCHIRVEETTCEGDRVVVRFTATGTQSGNLMGEPASGKKVSVTGVSILRVVHGKIAEEHVVWDQLGMLQQIRASESKRSSRAAR